MLKYSRPSHPDSIATVGPNACRQRMNLLPVAIDNHASIPRKENSLAFARAYFPYYVVVFSYLPFGVLCKCMRDIKCRRVDLCIGHLVIFFSVHGPQALHYTLVHKCGHAIKPPAPLLSADVHARRLSPPPPSFFGIQSSILWSWS